MRVAHLAPTAVTLAALSCGGTSIKWAVSGDVDGAIVLLLVSAVLDGLDGHCARYLNAVSRFGAELDSLCDLVNFGLAPTFVLASWSAKTGATDRPDRLCDDLVWACALLYMSACACRLARFNVGMPPLRESVAKELEKKKRAMPKNESADEDPTLSYPAARPDKALASNLNPVFRLSRSKFFAGVPAPMMALIVLTPIFYEHTLGPLFHDIPRSTIASSSFIVVGALGISEIPTLSSKMLSRDNSKATHLQMKTNSSGLVLLKTSGLPLFAYAVYTMWNTWQLWGLVFMCCGVYLASLPLGWVLYFYAKP